MKSTSSNWIGEIPCSWEEKQLGYAVKTIVPMRDKPKNLNGPIPWIRIEDREKKYIFKSKTNQGVTKEIVEYMNLKVYPVGTVLTSCSCSFGTSMIVKEPLISNQTFIGLYPDSKQLFSEYLYYQLYIWKEELERSSSGAIQQYLSQDNFQKLKFLFPPIYEQKLISQYLDKKTKQIDSLIEKIEKKIELLNEQKNALINQYVTKGMDPNVEIKDSGVNWIGDIPKHWGIKRLNIIGDFSKGKNITKSDLQNTGYPVILYSHIYTKYNRNVSIVDSYISKYKSIESTKIQSNTFLFTSSGETKDDIGKSLLYQGIDDISIGGDMVVYKFNEPHLYDPEYYSFVFNSFICQCQKSSMSRGEIVVHIYERQLREIRVCIPPIDEQKKINGCLIEIEANTKKLKENYQHKVQLLYEYRQSLISSVVTGKIRITEDMI